LVEEVALRAGGEVGAGGHGDAAGHRRGQAGEDNQRAALRGRGNATDEADGADEAVLDAEHELPHADLPLQLALLAAEGRDRNGARRTGSASNVGCPGFQSAGQRRPVCSAARMRSVSSTLRPTFCGVTVTCATRAPGARMNVARQGRSSSFDSTPKARLT